ncbi:hypothetical protein MMC18_004230 [Xylographa bjoerkii]|nr:hypothetical protein [Xylographa bjoerkii]
MSSSDDDRGSSSSEDDWTGLKNLVCSRIEAVHRTGSFATSGRFEKFVLPGIVVEEIGVIRLPLSTQDAQSLIQVSRQAPFGKGNQTLVDETVRKTWEIDGSKVSFSNKAWHGWLEGVVRTVAKDLGVACGPDSVRAELYKMLLYEKEAMFKPHKDTEKTSGMFGTLVICLPSEHVGGAVCLTHGQEKKTFETAEASIFNTTYIAWYADVTHEIKPIQSGYRWVLTYNLTSASSGCPMSATELDVQLDCFCQTLAYTDAGLKLAELKGDDYYRACYVANACRKVGDFCVLLASMQKVVTLPNDEGGEENAQSELRLNRILDLEGFALQKSLTIPEDFLLQPWLYGSRDNDEQHGGEYLGNQHADFDQYYNDSVMLIVPKALVTAFLLGKNHNVEDFKGLLQRLHTCFRTRNNDQHIRELIVQTCQNHLTLAYQNNGMKDLFLGQIAAAAMFVADQSLFRNAVRLVTSGFDESTFFALGELVDFQAPVIPEADLAEAISRTLKLHRIRRCLHAFRDGFSRNVSGSDEHQVQYLASWIEEKISEALKSLPAAYPQDAAALIEITKEYDDKMFEHFVKPFVAKFVGDSNFSNALAVEILSFSQCSSSDKDLVAHLLPFVLDAAATQFDLQKYSSAAKSSCRNDYPYSSWPGCYKEAEKGRRDASIVVALHQQILQSDQKKASELLGQIQSQTESLPHNELDRFIIPLLEQMIYTVDQCPHDAHRFYKSTMTTYIKRVVQKEPEKPSDWARPNEKAHCYASTCPDCQSLQEFLMDPEEESRSFVLSKDPWHLTSYVPRHFKQSTDKLQTPPVLIVTKTLQEWEESHSEWLIRASNLRKTFEQLPSEKLKQCLAEQYDVIMDLRVVKLQDDSSSTQAANTSEKSTKRPSDEQSSSEGPRKRFQGDS